MDEPIKLIFSGILIETHEDGSVLCETYSFNTPEHVSSDIGTYSYDLSVRFDDFCKNCNIGDTFLSVKHPIYCSITRTN